MKGKLFSFVVNSLFIIVIIIIVVAITSISYTQKIDQYLQQYQKGINAVVIKNKVPILALSKGIVSKVYVSEGDRVRAGQLLLEITNPLLQQQVQTLSKYKNNTSAQTQASLAKAELQYNKVYAPSDGVVSDINVTTNTPVDEYSNLMTIYQDTNTKLLTYLSVNQYITAQKMNKIDVFDPRLNQDFYFTIAGLKTDQESPNQQNQPTNKIALYLKPSNPKDALSLLNGETMQIEFNSTPNTVSKPVDYLVNFWNGLLKNK